MASFSRASRTSLLAGLAALVLATPAASQSRAPAVPEPSSPVLPEKAEESPGLRPVSDFDAIADERQRSIAIFEETGKVLTHPRCINCHPAGDIPLQGMKMTPHQPPVVRGPANFGAPGMMCSTCHGAENVEIVGQGGDLKSVPGNSNWHLAPIEMAWEGRSLGEICEQIKDENRNGGKTLAELVEHMAADDLVGWGWTPGEGREPAPGTWEEFGALYEAWAATGAHCPAG